MQVSNLEADLAKDTKRRVEDFNELIWYSSEVCNDCFQHVRSVGPEVTKTLQDPDEKLLEHGAPARLVVNQWYERTDHGTQEHTPWDSNKRFGTTFCRDCGSDTSAWNDSLSKDEMKSRARNLYVYFEEHTEYELEYKTLYRSVLELKSNPDNTGYDSEIFAVSVARALEA